MAIKTAAVTVPATAGGIALNTFGDTDGVFGSSVAVTNNGAATIYLGGTDVTTANGLPLPAGATGTFDCKPGDALCGIVATGTVEARVLASGV